MRREKTRRKKLKRTPQSGLTTHTYISSPGLAALVADEMVSWCPHSQLSANSPDVRCNGFPCAKYAQAQLHVPLMEPL